LKSINISWRLHQKNQILEKLIEKIWLGLLEKLEIKGFLSLFFLRRRRKETFNNLLNYVELLLSIFSKMI